MEESRTPSVRTRLLFWLISALIAALAFATTIKTVRAQDASYFHANYAVEKSSIGEMIKITKKQSGGALPIEGWWEATTRKHAKLEKNREHVSTISRELSAEPLFSRRGQTLCHADKKILFYSLRALKDGATAIVGRVIKLIPIPWLTGPINYIINRTTEFWWEGLRYEQEGLAKIIQSVPAASLGLSEQEISRCLSSMEEADHAIYAIHKVIGAWLKWDHYGVLERNKLRARALDRVLAQHDRYQTIGLAQTDVIYPVVTKKNNVFYGNFEQSAWWLTKKPTVSYWEKLPFAIAGMRWTFEALKFASSFIPVPVVPGLIRGMFNRAYIKQIQAEGQLHAHWRMAGKNLDADRLLNQSVNPFLMLRY